MQKDNAKEYEEETDRDLRDPSYLGSAHNDCNVETLVPTVTRPRVARSLF